MHYVQCVQSYQRIQNCLDDGRCIFLRVLTAFFDLVEQFLSLQILDDQMHITV